MVGRIVRRLRTLLRAGAVDRDISRELDFHVRMEIDQRVRAGLSPEEARRSTLRDFGSLPAVREDVRDARGMTWWDGLRQDIRFGLRTLRRSPGYTTAAVLILALGIGANTAMFSVVNGVLLEPLPYREGDDLVLVQQSVPAFNLATLGVSIPELYEYRERLASVRDLVEYHSMSFVLLNQGEPDRVDTGVVSANFFDMLGVRPLHGRTLVDTDDDSGAEAVLVLSHEYWQSKFGGEASVVGRVLEMNNRPHTVVGVLPPHPQYPRHNDVYMSTSACPFRSAQEANVATVRRAFGALQVFGRLAPGASVTHASTELAAIVGDFDDRFPDVYQRAGTRGEVVVQATPLREQLVQDARPMLLALTGTTMLVLLIACANVANLALARTVRRGRELAVRTALGAARGRLVRQLLTESVLVAGAGGVIGLGLAALSLELLTGFVGRFTPRTEQIGIDGTVLAFTLVAACATGVLFGLAPAVTVRRNLAGAMRDGGGQAGEGAGRQGARSVLVVAQVAVSFVLLVGAALLLESFYKLSSVPLGYQTDRIMTAALFGNFSVAQTPEEALRLNTAILERLRATPGVRAAAITNAVPQTAINPLQIRVRIEGGADENPIERDIDQRVASEGYFDLLGVNLIAGRDFRITDTATAPAVAIINQEMAGLWEGRDPIGRRFAVVTNAAPAWIEVVGVAGDFRTFGADREIVPQYYRPLTQVPFGGGRLLAATAGDPMTLVPAIKAAVHTVNATIPVEEIQTLEDLRSDRLSVPGVTAALLSIFAGVALFVTLAGIAGLIGTAVSQRTREFGLRMALGASRGSVLQLVLGQGVVLVAIGVVLGIGGAIAFSRLINRFLFETTPTDPLAYAIVAVVFVGAAIVAAVGPARRATTIDPLTALRAE
ncbi:MAG TPA: ABC transporter permease [Vicinamibacterales bacterium]|nr:ABC transporter permease [Vicinamibacterales bacterium]